ncbi:Response regulator receiver domain-containing protein [Candidatus Kryptonium thompsonii]|jgi:DNA-binding NtrC family response regulator|uniref:Response regulator receiver domain-containing protein n=3 Tax=Candidatus Kryptonium thompsonii TaxID=1633631 RepID=A0A0P1MPE0_9BACT|nr:response regulator [Candidatus Kryptonium thompsoni]CUS78010.1 Response regulator receiver domain-containing protein [Candidatus Kryptonium thompsoni]CUS87139.1 Response regulator receiver domain-containing protein [Candidatus Kryptonium thompsoni]CUS89180.1 Response regulator receiver domain-containing protein [Candidatus Kryptonium thompsoni]CUS90343.1 Response regulator receiver domain-containing protein [Candidatus Kryptonium thompsoni]CUS91531.1 Response regulator receiver domain-conta
MIDVLFLKTIKKIQEMRKVLVADADESMRNLLVKFLIKEGFEVCVAVSGKDAIEKMSQSKFDFIIIDENIYKSNQLDINSIVDKLMPKAKIIYIAPFYAFSERIEMEGDKVIKCGDKLFKISELKNLINEFTSSSG